MKSILSAFLVVFMIIGCKDQTSKANVGLTSQQIFIKNNPNTPEKIKESILNETVMIGMTEAQVLASWGEPNLIDVFNSDYNSYIRWNYNGKPMIYWKDGKVDKISK